MCRCLHGGSLHVASYFTEAELFSGERLHGVDAVSGNSCRPLFLCPLWVPVDARLGEPIASEWLCAHILPPVQAVPCPCSGFHRIILLPGTTPCLSWTPLLPLPLCPWLPAPAHGGVRSRTVQTFSHPVSLEHCSIRHRKLLPFPHDVRRPQTYVPLPLWNPFPAVCGSFGLLVKCWFC